MEQKLCGCSGITRCPVTNVSGHDLLKTQPHHHQTPTSRAPKLPGPAGLAVCGGCVGSGQVHVCWMKAQPLWLRGRVCVGSQELEPGCAAPCSPSLPSCASSPSYLIK